MSDKNYEGFKYLIKLKYNYCLFNIIFDIYII